MPTDSDSDTRDARGRYTPEFADEEILEAVRQHAPASTKEIADAVGCSRQNADRRLRQLRERGAVASKKNRPGVGVVARRQCVRATIEPEVDRRHVRRRLFRGEPGLGRRSP